MDKKTVTLKLALEAIEAEINTEWKCNSYHPKLYQAITAIREALAEQPAQEYIGGGLSTPFGYVQPAQPSKPLTDEEIKRLKPISADFVSFRAGVRCVEREYGIGAKR